MARRAILQTNFSAGELSPELGMRQDTSQYQNGAKSLRNRRCMIGGGTKRRPGSWRDIDLSGARRLMPFSVNESTKYVLAFSTSAMAAYIAADGDGVLTASGTLSGQPWNTTDIYTEMDWAQGGNTMFLVHESMAPQVLTRTSVSTWARSAYAFDTNSKGAPQQPYYKFLADAVTLNVSGTTGTVTLTASSALFVAGHVGTYFRYAGRGVRVTAVASSLSATATVIENLPRTEAVTVNNSSGFMVGDVVQGENSGARGTVVGLPGGNILYVLIDLSSSGFDADDELVVGPTTTSHTNAVSNTSPRAIKDWDEQMFSSVRGYPGCVTLHRSRLVFGGHASVPDLLIASQIGNLYNFHLGDGADADGIQESIGDAAATRIQQLHSAEQLLTLTDAGPYYCPEGPTSPFTPSRMAFFPFGSRWNISRQAKAQGFDDGVIFVSGSLVIKASPTGDASSSWKASEASLLCSHLISNPYQIAVTTNFAGGAERYCILLNDDGTLAVMQLVEQQDIRNFTPWDIDTSDFESVVALKGTLYAATLRSASRFIERFDQDLSLDLVRTYASSLSAVAADYSGFTVKVIAGGVNLGTNPVASPPAGPYTVGIDYVSQIETLPPVFDGREGPAAGDLIRIVESYIFADGYAQLTARGYELQAVESSEAITGPQRFQFLGWERQPTITIIQTDPLEFDVHAIRQTVAYR